MSLRKFVTHGPLNEQKAGTLAKYPYCLPLLVIEWKMPILYLIYPIYIMIRHYHHSHILELITRSQQRPSLLSWQSVALDSRGREFDSHRKGWVLENLHTRKIFLSFTFTTITDKNGWHDTVELCSTRILLGNHNFSNRPPPLPSPVSMLFPLW